MRGILHALERHAPTLQRAGDLPLLIQQLREWVARNADAWGTPGPGQDGDSTMSLAAMAAAAGSMQQQ